MAQSRSDLSTCVQDVESAYQDFLDGANYIMSGISIDNIRNAFISFHEGVDDVQSAIYACEQEIQDFDRIYEEFETIKKIFSSDWDIGIEVVRIFWNWNSISTDVTNIVHAIQSNSECANDNGETFGYYIGSLFSVMLDGPDSSSLKMGEWTQTVEVSS